MTKIEPCSFTGGCEEGLTPLQNALKELRGEAGFTIQENDSLRITSLGTTFSTKSSDSIYHLFAFNVSGLKQSDLYVESDLENSSFNTWVSSKEYASLKDPFAVALMSRWILGLGVK